MLRIDIVAFRAKRLTRRIFCETKYFTRLKVPFPESGRLKEEFVYRWESRVYSSFAMLEKPIC